MSREFVIRKCDKIKTTIYPLCAFSNSSNMKQFCPRFVWQKSQRWLKLTAALRRFIELGLVARGGGGPLCVSICTRVTPCTSCDGKSLFNTIVLGLCQQSQSVRARDLTLSACNFVSWGPRTPAHTLSLTRSLASWRRLESCAQLYQRYIVRRVGTLGVLPVWLEIYSRLRARVNQNTSQNAGNLSRLKYCIGLEMNWGYSAWDIIDQNRTATWDVEICYIRARWINY